MPRRPRPLLSPLRPPRRRRRSNRRKTPLREVLSGALRGTGRQLYRRRRIFAALALAGALGTGAHFGLRWAASSPRFSIDDVEVSGGAHLSSAELERVVDPVRGLNLFRVDTAAVRRAAEELGWVASAEVRRRLPDRLEIDVTEREAAAVVSLGGLYLVEADGVPFKRASVIRGEAEGLPVVTGLERADYHNEPDSAAAAIRGALELHALYAAGDRRPALSEIHLDKKRGFSLVLADSGARVELGTGDIHLISERLARFDTSWAALSATERGAARTFFLDNDTRVDNVTIAFASPPDAQRASQ